MMWEKDQKVSFNLYKYKCLKNNKLKYTVLPPPPPPTHTHTLTLEGHIEHLGEEG